MKHKKKYIEKKIVLLDRNKLVKSRDIKINRTIFFRLLLLWIIY